MDKTKQCDGVAATGDSTGLADSGHRFHDTAEAWLVGEALTRLHGEESEARGGYARATELLAKIGAAEAFAHVFASAPREDVSLRWSLLYILADTGEMRAADLFARAAIEPIRVERDPLACESAYDGEVLVRTMAIEGLGRLAQRDAGLIGHLYKVIESQPDCALRIEAVKAVLAAAPAEAERLRHVLPQELHFALELKRVRAQTLVVDEFAAAKDAVREMPALDGRSVRPSANHKCCC